MCMKIAVVGGACLWHSERRKGKKKSVLAALHAKCGFISSAQKYSQGNPPVATPTCGGRWSSNSFLATFKKLATARYSDQIGYSVWPQWEGLTVSYQSPKERFFMTVKKNNWIVQWTMSVSIEQCWWALNNVGEHSLQEKVLVEFWRRKTRHLMAVTSISVLAMHENSKT